ncbi:hypothetical protein STEG23_006602 [Scotinomys teguina]
MNVSHHVELAIAPVSSERIAVVFVIQERTLTSAGKELQDNFLKALAMREEDNRNGKVSWSPSVVKRSFLDESGKVFQILEKLFGEEKHPAPNTLIRGSAFNQQLSINLLITKGDLSPTHALLWRILSGVLQVKYSSTRSDY